MTYFCTYFDGRYAARALLMLRSLDEVFPSARVLALALDPEASALESRAPSGTRFFSLDALGRAPTAFPGATVAGMAERGRLMELKPAWLTFALACVPPGDTLAYVDADMYFLSSPQEALEEAGSSSVALSPQRFSDPRGDAFWGRFNGGWIGLRNDSDAERFLAAWSQDCEGRMSPTYSNQKFLDQAAARLPGVRALNHPGINVAHWNAATVTVEDREGGIFVNGRPLVAYHMAGLFPIAFGYCVTSLPGKVLKGVLRDRVYEPYLQGLRLTARELGLSPAQALDRVDWPKVLKDRALLRISLWRQWAGGGAVRI